jgi:integrase
MCDPASMLLPARASVTEAAESWIKASEANELETTTIDQYRQHARFHINPFIGTLKLCDLNVQAVRKFEDRLRTEGRSAVMIRKVLSSLGSIVADAQEQGLAARNAVRELRRNRRSKGQGREKRQKRKLEIGVDIPSPDEVKGILAHAKGRWRPLLLTAAFTGLRGSELRGLRWKDVDFTANRIHIRQRADRYRKIGDPKSQSSHRAVPFGKFVANTLKEWKLACPHGELVFPNVKGGVEFHQHIVNRGLIPSADRRRSYG